MLEKEQKSGVVITPKGQLQAEVIKCRDVLHGVVENRQWIKGMEDWEIAKLRLKQYERREAMLAPEPPYLEEEIKQETKTLGDILQGRLFIP